MVDAQPDLSLTEWAVLAIVCEGPTHGFAVAKELSPDGDLGRIWTVARPVVYRSLARLDSMGLVETAGSEPGDGGPIRTKVRATIAGQAAVGEWIEATVRHVRDLRTRLLLQLRLLERRQRDVAPLATAQLDALVPVIEGLRTRAESTPGFDGLLALWRYETAQAAARVLRSVAARETTSGGFPVSAEHEASN